MSWRKTCRPQQIQRVLFALLLYACQGSVQQRIVLSQDLSLIFLSPSILRFQDEILHFYNWTVCPCVPAMPAGIFKHKPFYLCTTLCTWAPWSPLLSGWWDPAQKWRRFPYHQEQAQVCTWFSPVALAGGHATLHCQRPAETGRHALSEQWGKDQQKQFCRQVSLSRSLIRFHLNLNEPVVVRTTGAAQKAWLKPLSFMQYCHPVVFL